jgi:RNA polymerase sigma-70 factor (ECF subfamily)
MKLRFAIAKEATTAGTRRSDLVDTLYERHLGKVKRWARRLAGPWMDLEDVVHDIFLIAFRKGFQFRGDASVETWLFRIAEREIRGKRRRIRLRQALLGLHQDTLVPPPPDTPQEEMERQERHARLYRALDRLPDRYRTALILFEIEELPGERVAEMTGVRLSAVWVTLHRGRERLLRLLTEEDRT